MMILIDKKVDFQVLDNLEEVRNKWIEIFAGNLTERERKEISIDNHLWYAFNSEKKDYLEGEEDELAGIEYPADLINDRPPLAPELIGGLLRKGHKMIISGASKSGGFGRRR